MPSTSVNLEKHIGALNSVLTEQAEQHAVKNSKPPTAIGWSPSIG